MINTTFAPIELVQQNEETISQAFIGRRDEIHVANLALILGQHMFLYGPSGVAKSALVKAVLEQLPFAHKFHLSLGKYTTPEKLFGHLDLDRFKRGVYHYNSRGFLPEADVAFGDEFFDAGDAVLDELKEAINERTWTNGAERLELPLNTFFGASNHLPRDMGPFGALWDRFLFRTVVPTLSTADEIRQLWHLKELSRVAPIDLKLVRKTVSEVEITDEVEDALLDVIVKLAATGVSLTPRRMALLPSVVQAEAAMDNSDVTQVKHLAPLVHCMWNHPDDIPNVERVLAGVLSPTSGAAFAVIEAIDKALDLHQRHMRSDSAQHTFLEFVKQGRKAILRSEKVSQKRVTGRPRDAMDAKVAELEQAFVLSFEQEQGERPNHTLLEIAHDTAA